MNMISPQVKNRKSVRSKVSMYIEEGATAVHRIPGIPLKKQGLRRSITRLPRYPSRSSGGSSQKSKPQGKSAAELPLTRGHWLKHSLRY